MLKYNKARGRLENLAVDEHSSPYYKLRDRQGNAIGVTACDIDGDGREEIYFLNTNNAFSGECWTHPSLTLNLPMITQLGHQPSYLMYEFPHFLSSDTHI